MLIIGWLFTGLWLVGLVTVVILSSDSALKLGLNEWGDFLSGSFAPLAFFWLVLGYFQQGRELRLSTEALKHQEKALMLQVEELKQSVLQQQALAEVAREEIELNRESLARQRAREKKNLQPVAEARFNQYQIRNNDHFHWGRIYNTGEKVSMADIDCRDTNFLVEATLNTPNSKWDGDNYLDVSIVAPASAIFNEGDEVRFSILYVDGLGEHEEVKIFLELNKDGDFFQRAPAEWMGR